jgi:hypothetical protein
VPLMELESRDSMFDSSRARRWLARACRIAGLVLIGATAARAQSIRGEIRDETTKQPIARVTVSLLDAKDSTLRNVLSSDSGRFSVTLPGPGTYSLSLRRVGWSQLMTKPFTVRANDTVSALTFEMVRRVVALDTVVSVESRGVFAMTPGKEYVRKHFAEGIGMIISGWEIEKSGLKLSQYLGQQAGLHLSEVYAPGTPLVPGDNGMAVLSDVSTQCLYARVDRFSVISMLIQEAAETIDEMMKVKDIMAVEVYLDHREMPKEWKQDAWVTELYSRLNSGRQYIIGHTGFPTIRADELADEPGRFATQRVASLDRGAGSSLTRTVVTDADGVSSARYNGSGVTMIPPCGFLQIWTARAW